MPDSPIIWFNSSSKPPYNLLSNFHGHVELHFMAARFEHPPLEHLLTDRFATCSPAQFRQYLRALHPAGDPAKYIRTATNDRPLVARGILGKLAGNAAISQSAAARRRMRALKKLAGIPQEEIVRTNTDAILRAAGLALDKDNDDNNDNNNHNNSGKPERESENYAARREQAIQVHNDALMRACLRRKFRRGHCADDGTEFRRLLCETGKSRLRERGFGRGNRWTGSKTEDGVLGSMLMALREEIRREEGESSSKAAPSSMTFE